MEDSDWHIFLAVVRQGSTLAASRRLGVSQSTVSRRIDALEAVLGLRLFDRSPAGYVPTAAGAEMVPRAEAIAEAVGAALAFARQQQRAVAGEIRFTIFAASGQTFISAAVREFRQAFPEVRVEVVATEERLDLMRGEADVAMRAGPRPVEPGLVMRRLLTDGWSVCCARDYADQQGMPQGPEDLARHAVLSLSSSFGDYPIMRWLAETVPEDRIVMRYHDLAGVLAGLKEGIGVGLMSDMMAQSAGLVPCFVPPVTFEAPVWLITTEKLQKEPRIRAFLDFMAGYMARRTYRKPSG